MSIEIVVSPRSERVRVELADAPAWSAYAAELRRVVGTVIEESGVDLLTISELLVSQPLPGKYSSLRNGVEIHPLEAIDLVEEMVAGRGPYCRLSTPGRLCIESGWDGAVYLYATRAATAGLAGFHGREMSLFWRDAVPEPVDVPNPVGAVAGESFWDEVREVSGRVTLLCERWAHGAYGCRWFRVTPENATEVAQLVWPRSLLRVVAGPDLEPRPEVLDDDFTAFMAPLSPGELVYRAYPGGADSLADVMGEGFSFMLADKVLDNWCAVVPDRDGVIRVRWDDPGAS